MNANQSALNDMARFSGPDVVCCITGVRGATYHHIYAQKPYPKLRHTKWNMIPFEHRHHELAHKKGMVYMSVEFPKVQYWLIANGWKMCPLMRKWVHDLPEGMDLKGTSPEQGDL